MWFWFTLTQQPEIVHSLVIIYSEWDILELFCRNWQLWYILLTLMRQRLYSCDPIQTNNADMEYLRQTRPKTLTWSNNLLSSWLQGVSVSLSGLFPLGILWHYFVQICSLPAGIADTLISPTNPCAAPCNNVTVSHASWHERALSRGILPSSPSL